MSSGVELLRNTDPSGKPNPTAFGIMQRQLKHLMRLVDDLLDVERLTHGRITLRTRRVPATEIVEAALESCRPLLEANTHRLNVSIPGVASVEGDPARLAQIISNLLDNAYKYTPVGGSIDLSVEIRNRQLLFRVRDSGMGISPDALPLIFNTYFQGLPLSGSDIKGLGIGLALVRRLTEAHGGTVSVTSPGTGKGSEFVVSLPVATLTLLEEEIPSTPARAEVTAENGQIHKILLVDDNQDSVEAMALVLSAAGHEVRTAVDGPGALEVVKEFSPEIAILDIGLPGMDGHQLAHRLRQIVPDTTLICSDGVLIPMIRASSRQVSRTVSPSHWTQRS